MFWNILETKSQSHGHSHGHTGTHDVTGPSAALYLDVLKQYLIEYFGLVREDENEAKYKFDFEVPVASESYEQVVEVAVSMEDFSVECIDERAKTEVERIVSRVVSLLDVDYII